MSATGASLPLLPIDGLAQADSCPSSVFHIPFVLALPQFELVSIYERRATADYSEARKAFPQVKVVNTLAGVLEDASIELVFVSTINDTHLEYTKVRSIFKHVLRPGSGALATRSARTSR